MSDTASEQWRPVLGYEEHYEVSDAGNCRSIDRWVTFSDGRVRFFKGKLKRKKIGAHGYPLVLLSAGMEKKRWRQLHLVVLEAFIGLPPSGTEACHNDGNRQNAALSNLRYDTRKSNRCDMWLHGTMPFGEAHPSAHISDALADHIRAASGTVTEMAEQFGVSRTHVWNIRNRKRRASVAEMLA